MPEDVRRDCVGAIGFEWCEVASCLEPDAHVHAGAEGGWVVCDPNLLERCTLEEAAVVAEGGDVSIKGPYVTFPCSILPSSTKVRVPVRLPKPPTERVVRPEEREVAVERWVFRHVGVVSGVCSNDARRLSFPIHVFKEGEPKEEVVGAEHADDVPPARLDADRLGFLTVAFRDDVDLGVRGECLDFDRREEGIKESLVLGPLARDDKTQLRQGRGGPSARQALQMGWLEPTPTPAECAGRPLGAFGHLVGDRATGRS